MKRILIFSIAMSFIATVLTGCTTNENIIEVEPNVAIMTEYDGVVNDTKVVPISVEEAINFFKENKTGILLFSRPTCPWCQKAVPVLTNVAVEKDFAIYYVDTDTYIDTWDDGKQELIPILQELLFKYDVVDAEGNFNIYIPMVVSVQNGNPIDLHIGTIDSDTDYDALLDAIQIEELSGIYRMMAHEIKLF